MAETGTRTSTTLLERVALTGDDAACAEFVARYTPMVRAIAQGRNFQSADVDDVAQEVMAAAVNALRLHRYDRDRGKFKAWLKGVVYHKINDVRRRQAKQAGRRPDLKADSQAEPVSHGSVPEDLIDPSPTPDEQFQADFEAAWRQVALEEALDEIRHEVEPSTFQAFDLCVREDMPVREVAKLLGLTRNAVYVAKSRILKRLRENLGEDGDE